MKINYLVRVPLWNSEEQNFSLTITIMVEISRAYRDRAMNIKNNGRENEKSFPLFFN